MNLFDKRPLCLILCIMLGGFIFFTESSESVKIVLFALALIFLVVSIYFLISKITKTKLYVISASALLLSYLLSFLYFTLYFNAYDRFDDEVTITGTVTDLDYKYNGYSVEIECDRIDDTSYSKKISAFISYDEASNLKKNDVISMNGILCDFDNAEDFDTRSYQRAKGVSARLTDINDVNVIERSDTSFTSKIKAYRKAVCEYIIENSNETGGGLLAALLFGERDYISSSTQLSYKRAGLSHTLALSGMHLAILSFALNRFLSLFGIRKKARKIFEMLFVVVYMTLTGFPISVVRAGVMLLISSLLFLLSTKADQITTLSIAVVVICIISPESIYDISLWLSALATLGLLIYIELNENKPKRSFSITRKIFSDFLAAIIISAFAIGATLMISFMSFGAISLIGPISSPIFALAIELFIYLGLIFIAFGHYIGMGDAIAFCGDLINDMIRWVSSLDGIYLSTSEMPIQILIYLFTTAAVMFIIFKIKHKRIYLLTLATIMIAIYGAAYLNYIDATDDTRLDYIASEHNEHFFLSSNNEITVVNISDNSENDAYETLDYIFNNDLYDIDNLVITSYTENVEEYIHIITKSIYVDNIYIPKPLTNDEEKLFSSVYTSVENEIYNIVSYTSDDFLDFGAHTMMLTSRFDHKDYDRCSLLFFNGDETIAYISSGMLNQETKSVADDMINGADSVIFGRHGDNYEDQSFILKIASIKRMIICSDDFVVSEDVLYFYRNTEIIMNKDCYSFIR